jgi:ActR/RegA family two-component response regulator
MKLNALLLCRNQQSLAVLKRELGELGIAGTVCESAAETMEALAQNHQSALVLDFDMPGAVQVARVARTLVAEHKPVIFAMIGMMTPVGSAIQLGVNFVLYKPLHADQVAHFRTSIRCGRHAGVGTRCERAGPGVAGSRAVASGQESTIALCSARYWAYCGSDGRSYLV